MTVLGTRGASYRESLSLTHTYTASANQTTTSGVIGVLTRYVALRSLTLGSLNYRSWWSTLLTTQSIWNTINALGSILCRLSRKLFGSTDLLRHDYKYKQLPWTINTDWLFILTRNIIIDIVITCDITPYRSAWSCPSLFELCQKTY